MLTLNPKLKVDTCRVAAGDGEHLLCNVEGAEVEKDTANEYFASGGFGGRKKADTHKSPAVVLPGKRVSS